MKNNQLKLGAVLSYVQMAVNILVGLLYTPVMLRLLGQAEYGLYNTVSSIIAMMSVLNLGFSSSYIRYYTQYIVRKENEKIDKLNGLFLIIFSIIGVVALVCGLVLAGNLHFVFDQGLTPTEYATAKVLMLLLTFNLAVSFPMLTFTCIISAHERYVFLKLMGIVKTVLSPFLTLPLLFMGYRSVAMAFVTILVALIIDAIYLFYARKELKIKFCFRGFDKGIFTSVLVFSSFIAINIVVDQINNNMDKFLLGRFIGTKEVAVYSVGYTLYHYYMFFSLGISSVFAPRIHKIINSTLSNLAEQRKQLTELFTKIGRIQYLLLALVASGVVFFGKEFIVMWADEAYSNAYYVALILIIPATVPFIQNAGIEIQRALNKHWFCSICYLVMALINLVISIKLCQLYGSIGSAIGTGISFILANGIIMNVFYHKQCNVDMIYFWKNILRISLGLVLPVAAGIMLKRTFVFDSWFSFLAGAICYSFIYCLSMWFFAINKYEKNLVFKVINRVGKRA